MSYLKRRYSKDEEYTSKYEKEDNYPIEFIVEFDSEDQDSDGLIGEDNASESVDTDCENCSSETKVKKIPIVYKRINNKPATSKADNETEHKFNNHKSHRCESSKNTAHNENDESGDSPIKRRKTESLNEDIMFLRSLAPYFKLLEPTRKLVMRSRIQDLLLKEIADQDSCEINT